MYNLRMNLNPTPDTDWLLLLSKIVTESSLKLTPILQTTRDELKQQTAATVQHRVSAAGEMC